jgi:hypothetical protein
VLRRVRKRVGAGCSYRCHEFGEQGPEGLDVPLGEVSQHPQVDVFGGRVDPGEVVASGGGELQQR